MNIVRRLSLLLIAACIAGCAMRSKPEPAPAALFVLVRHAEKAADDPRDPGLTGAGLARAQDLAERLTEAPLIAAYATEYRRTQMTAAPAAARHGIEVRGYAAATPASEFAARLRGEHRTGVVLIVGHSNTVAQIASALCLCAVAPLRDDEYDRLIEIRIAADGGSALVEHRY